MFLIVNLVDVVLKLRLLPLIVLVLKVIGMLIDLQTKVDIFKQDKKGKNTLFKKNVIQRVFIDTLDIESIKENINAKGNIDKSTCILYVKNIGEILINHSFDYIKGLKLKNNQIGFKLNQISNERKRKKSKSKNI